MRIKQYHIDPYLIETAYGELHAIKIGGQVVQPSLEVVMACLAKIDQLQVENAELRALADKRKRIIGQLGANA